MLRSPVELDASCVQNSIHKTNETPEIDQTISEVASGQGKISVSGTSVSTSAQSSSIRTLADRNGSVQTKTVLSSSSSSYQATQTLSYNPNMSQPSQQNVVNITREYVPPTAIVQTRPSIFGQQLTTDNSTKRNQSNATESTKTKRPRKTTVNIPHLTTTIAPSYSNTSQTITTIPSITSTSNSLSKSLPHTNIDMLLTSSLFTATPAPIDTLNQDSTDDFFDALNAGQGSFIPDGFMSVDGHEHTDFTITPDDFDFGEFSQTEIEGRYGSLTPPVPMSASNINQILTPASTGRSSTTSSSTTNPEVIYDVFFLPPHQLPSSLGRNETPVASFVPPTNSLLEQQYHSQTHERFNSDPQSQVRLLSNVQS